MYKFHEEINQRATSAQKRIWTQEASRMKKSACNELHE